MHEVLFTTDSDGLIDEKIRPELEASAMLRNYVDVSFDRRNMHGIVLETRFDGGSWVFAGRYFISPATIRIRNDIRRPRHVEIRARYIKDMQPVGQESDPVAVVITP